VILVIDASAVYDVLAEGRCAQRISGAEEPISPDLIVAELVNERVPVR